MLKHTPGPWMIQEDNLGCKIIIGNLKMTDEEYSLFTCNEIGFTDGLSDESEDIANARLVSAAPDLLEACKELLSEAVILSEDYLGCFDDYADDTTIQGWDKARWKRALAAAKKAKAAIAKAEGGE